MSQSPHYQAVELPHAIILPNMAYPHGQPGPPAQGPSYPQGQMYPPQYYQPMGSQPHPHPGFAPDPNFAPPPPPNMMMQYPPSHLPPGQAQQVIATNVTQTIHQHYPPAGNYHQQFHQHHPIPNVPTHFGQPEVFNPPPQHSILPARPYLQQPSSTSIPGHIHDQRLPLPSNTYSDVPAATHAVPLNVTTGIPSKGATAEGMLKIAHNLYTQSPQEFIYSSSRPPPSRFLSSYTNLSTSFTAASTPNPSTPNSTYHFFEGPRDIRPRNSGSTSKPKGTSAEGLMSTSSATSTPNISKSIPSMSSNPALATATSPLLDPHGKNRKNDSDSTRSVDGSAEERLDGSASKRRRISEPSPNNEEEKQMGSRLLDDMSIQNPQSSTSPTNSDDAGVSRMANRQDSGYTSATTATPSGNAIAAVQANQGPENAPAGRWQYDEAQQTINPALLLNQPLEAALPVAADEAVAAVLNKQYTSEQIAASVPFARITWDLALENPLEARKTICTHPANVRGGDDDCHMLYRFDIGYEPGDDGYGKYCQLPQLRMDPGLINFLKLNEEFGHIWTTTLSQVPNGGTADQYLGEKVNPGKWALQIAQMQRTSTDNWLPVPIFSLAILFPDTPWAITSKDPFSTVEIPKEGQTEEFTPKECESLLKYSMERLTCALLTVPWPSLPEWEPKPMKTWAELRTSFFEEFGWAPTEARLKVLDLLFWIDLVTYFQGLGEKPLHPWSRKFYNERRVALGLAPESFEQLPFAY